MADTQIDRRSTGIYHKFNVGRTDGTSEPGGKHHGCEYFVLDLHHDKHAVAALWAYAADCEDAYPVLATELRLKAERLAERLGLRR